MARASNTAAISFPQPTGNWSDATHYGIYDASTGGNLLVAGALTNDVPAATTGASVSFAAGALDIIIPSVDTITGSAEVTHIGAKHALLAIIGTGGSRHVSLHTAAPVVGGSSNELTSTSAGYARVAIAGGSFTPSSAAADQTAGGWTVNNSNAA